jgi:hypothetical protein
MNMDYTHYFGMNAEPKSEEITQALAEMKSLCKRHKALIKDVSLTKTLICFDGADDSCENFFVPLDGEIYNGFCKTRELPYDIAVCESLIVLASVFSSFSFDSDGFVSNPQRLSECPNVSVINDVWKEAIANVKKHHGINCDFGYVLEGICSRFQVLVNGRDAFQRDWAMTELSPSLTAAGDTGENHRRHLYSSSLLDPSMSE